MITHLPNRPIKCQKYQSTGITQDIIDDEPHGTVDPGIRGRSQS